MVFICSPVYIIYVTLMDKQIALYAQNCFRITTIFASPSPCSNRCYFLPSLLRVLENVLLLETYTQESIPALHKIRYYIKILSWLQVPSLAEGKLLIVWVHFRKYLLEATEEASIAYNKAVSSFHSFSYFKSKYHSEDLLSQCLMMACLLFDPPYHNLF